MNAGSHTRFTFADTLVRPDSSRSPPAFHTRWTDAEARERPEPVVALTEVVLEHDGGEPRARDRERIAVRIGEIDQRQPPLDAWKDPVERQPVAAVPAQRQHGRNAPAEFGRPAFAEEMRKRERQRVRVAERQARAAVFSKLFRPSASVCVVTGVERPVVATKCQPRPTMLRSSPVSCSISDGACAASRSGSRDGSIGRSSYGIRSACTTPAGWAARASSCATAAPAGAGVCHVDVEAVRAVVPRQAASAATRQLGVSRTHASTCRARAKNCSRPTTK